MNRIEYSINQYNFHGFFTIFNVLLDFERAQANTGLTKIRFHDLRHAPASQMLNHKFPVTVVSKMLDHSKPNIKLDIYGHPYHEMQGEAAEIMD